MCASDVEWAEFEHCPKSQEMGTLEALLKSKRQAHLENIAGVDSADITSIEAIINKAIKSRRFKLEPKLFGSCAVKISPNDLVLEQQLMKCNVTQIPVTASDAIPGHKLQGLTKHQFVVYSWIQLTGWMCIILSRMRTLQEIFLLQSLKLSDIKPPSRDYLAFMERMRKLERFDLDSNM